jgi:hypothetical protein
LKQRGDCATVKFQSLPRRHPATEAQALIGIALASSLVRFACQLSYQVKEPVGLADEQPVEVNAGVVELIKDVFTIRNQLLSGSDGSIEAMSGRLGMNKCRLTSLIRLSYLAPDIVRALLEGRQPIELTPTRLLRLSKDLPHDWSEQRHVLGFAA